jgi:hypothetical protein
MAWLLPNRRSKRMPKQKARPTTAQNLEARFDAGEDVLDYFNLQKAKLINVPGKPASKSSDGGKMHVPLAASAWSERPATEETRVQEAGGDYRAMRSKGTAVPRGPKRHGPGK